MNKTFFKNIFLYLVFAFLFLPIIVLVIYSFNSSAMNIIFENFTFDWYKRLFENKDLIESFMNTLIVAGVSTVISTIIEQYQHMVCINIIFQEKIWLMV